MVGDRWFVSSRATRWLEAIALEHVGMVLGDPRLLLRFAADPAVDDGLTTDATYVVRSGVDRSGLISYMLQGKDWGNEAPNLEKSWGPFIGGTRVGFWIDRKTFIISQMEVDYPALRMTPDRAVINPPTPVNPPPTIVKYDFSSPVDVPTSPVSMPGADVHRLDKEARDREPVILRAREAYKKRLGVYPPSLDPVMLHDFLDAPWPDNPYTTRPMRQVVDYSPGDFCYSVQDDSYRMELFGWDNSLGSTIPSCDPGQ